MKTEKLLSAIVIHVNLDNEEKEILIKYFSTKTVKKKEILLNEGDKCDSFFYVNSGILRAYVIGNSGKESTIMFAKEGWWITDMYCFLNAKPSMTHIEAVSEADLLVLSRTNFDKILSEIPKLERFFRILMQNAYTREQLRIIENLTLTAEVRYHNFNEKYPELIKQITQKQIASYIGISPEFLSVLRAKTKNLI
jgi:CRP-like cAMP-binding protein